MKVDRYSRMVALLKVTLPLLALGILSTLFLISRSFDPTGSIPFADTEVQERLSNQQVTGPYFSGTTAEGDQIAFVAEKLTTTDGRTGTNYASDVDVQLDFAGGGRAMVTARDAEVNIAADRAELTGDVVVVTSNGYTLESDLLKLRLSQIEVISPDAVFGTTPFGTIEAGSMHLLTPDGQTGSQLLFTGGVKLLYQPQS